MNVSSIRLATWVLAVLLPAVAPAAETRVALVIGNSAYSSGSLPNPVNDAKLISEGLKSVGFEVIARHNADQTAMKRAIQEFGERLEKAGPDSVGLFYYAGHGVQLNGRNYLIPTTANIEREGDVEIEAVSADWVIEQMRFARNRLNIVILDACRNNPFSRGLRSVERGLATMDAPAGIMIAYSTAPGAVAEDGNGRNSPYTTALTQSMLRVRQPVEQMFKQVRVEVMAATSGKQVPWESSSLTGDFYFTGPASAPAPLVRPDENTHTAEKSVADTSSGSSTGWFAWLSGFFSSSAPATAAKPPVTQIAMGASVPGARALELFSTLGIDPGEIDAAHSYPEATIRQLIENAPRRVTLGSTTGQMNAALALCRQYAPACEPQAYSTERLREVTLKPYELDSSPVSVHAFRQFANATGYKTHAERIGFAYAMVPGTEREERVSGGSWRNALKRHPLEEDSAVVGVSYQDAAAFCQSGGARLPTEDEWEYAARGPKRSIFPWGDDATPVARSLSSAPRATDGPAEGIGGGYKGLSGNVWQWVDTRSAGGTRVLKGGSWLEANPANKRAATRRAELPDTADEDSGFRCAKTVAAWPDADLWMSQLQSGVRMAEGGR